jgi:hypothetical protein
VTVFYGSNQAGGMHGGAIDKSWRQPQEHKLPRYLHMYCQVKLFITQVEVRLKVI